MSVQSFNAECDEHTHTLVLGTMPGVASLDAVEYYAHKRNAFWPILLSMIDASVVSFDSPHTLDYQTRIAKLLSNGIGLWDVLAQCERDGSLDSAIKADSVVVNDFVGLLSSNKNIRTLVFNGKTAQKLFKKHVMPALIASDIKLDSIRMVGAPSTSPAYASLTLEQKYDSWALVVKLE